MTFGPLLGLYPQVLVLRLLRSGWLNFSFRCFSRYKYFDLQRLARLKKYLLKTFFILLVESIPSKHVGPYDRVLMWTFSTSWEKLFIMWIWARQIKQELYCWSLVFIQRREEMASIDEVFLCSFEPGIASLLSIWSFVVLGELRGKSIQRRHPES